MSRGIRGSGAGSIAPARDAASAPFNVGRTDVSDTINLIREEIAELQRLVEEAGDQGLPDNDPAVLGYLRELLARKELVEELEELDRLRRGA